MVLTLPLHVSCVYLVKVSCYDACSGLTMGVTWSVLSNMINKTWGGQWSISEYVIIMPQHVLNCSFAPKHLIPVISTISFTTVSANPCPCQTFWSLLSFKIMFGCLQTWDTEKHHYLPTWQNNWLTEFKLTNGLTHTPLQIRTVGIYTEMLFWDSILIFKVCFSRVHRSLHRCLHQNSKYLFWHILPAHSVW